MMRLTRQSEIAFGILAACAERPAVQIRTQRIADITHTTKDHAAQVVCLLVKHGYLSTIRGRKGGILLAADPGCMALGEILRITQPELADHSQPKSDSVNPVLNTILEAAFGSFISLMDRFTVADLAALPASRRVACLDCSLINPVHRMVSRLPGERRKPAMADERTRWPVTPIQSERPNQERTTSHVLRLPS